MFFTPVTSDDVVNVIKILPNKKTTGPDDIPISIIKANCELIAPILSELINASVLKGVFPSSLKQASIALIFKKGDPLDVENYRPIALLSIFSKIIEKVIAIKLESFLNKNQIITESQYGFRAGFSTDLCTTDCVQYINDNIDDGKYVAAVYFDLSRAFDTVCGRFMSEKLHNIGIRDSINLWLTSFLEKRNFFVKIGDSRSDEFDVEYGTPQGSVLGPLMFILYINDLPHHLSAGKLFLYADDTCVIVTAVSQNELIQKIQTVTIEFQNWCSKNRLIINFSKTVIVQYFKNKIPPIINFLFNNITIESSNSCKFLGVFLDSRLSWEEQVKFCMPQIKQKLLPN